MNLVTIFRSFTSADAELTRARLEIAGFHPVIMGDLATLSMEGQSVATGGIRVQVMENEAAEARAFLDAEPAAE